MRVFLIGLILSLSACGSMPVDPPALENRSLRISADIAGFEYRYEVCTGTNIFGGCKGTKWVTETYDLTDMDTRKMLIHMGFVGKVREKILP